MEKGRVGAGGAKETEQGCRLSSVPSRPSATLGLGGVRAHS